MQHPNNFDKGETLVPICICLMKLQMEFTLEVMCIALIAFSTNTDEAIMDFIALNVISELDESYFKAMKDPLKDKIISIEYLVPITVTSKKEVYQIRKNMNCLQKCFWIFLQGIYFLHDVLYFHYFHVPVVMIFIYLDKFVLLIHSFSIEIL